MSISRNVSKLVASGVGALLLATAMVKPMEGIEYKPYRDVAGVLTVCYGMTGPDVIEGKTYTQSECDALLEHQLKVIKAEVDPLITTTITESQKAALYSFTYNVGVGAFKTSTLLRKLNQGDVISACNELKRWVYAAGKVWKGLVTRRAIEREICLAEQYQ